MWGKSEWRINLTKGQSCPELALSQCCFSSMSSYGCMSFVSLSAFWYPFVKIESMVLDLLTNWSITLWLHHYITICKKIFRIFSRVLVHCPFYLLTVHDHRGPFCQRDKLLSMVESLHHNKIFLNRNYTRGSCSLCFLHRNANFSLWQKGPWWPWTVKKNDLERSL